MPFDTSAFTTTDQVADPTALYRERREKAAALWETVLVEQFFIGRWSCGTVACALGYLAHVGHDGWQPMGDMPVWHYGATGFRAGEIYFGLSENDACACFGLSSFCERLYDKDRYDITPIDVARTLLALPYTLPDAA